MFLVNAFKVKIFEAKGTKALSIGKASFCVGSGKQCDVILQDPTIQTEHVRIWCEGGRLWIQDLGTESGTTINDMKLPPLKPMLCREIDTLQLGTSPFTLSIEPVFVRAPQVKPAEAAKVPIRSTDVDGEAATARRNELANASRELAELRLQLQMARLEKEAVEEIKKYRERIQEQIKELEVKKNHMLHEMSEWEKDKVTFRKNLEKELTDLRLQALKELKETTEEETKKFETWRAQCVDEMNKLVILLMGRKVKPLVGKTVSGAQVKQLERDVTAIMRRVLLNETDAEENVVQELYNYDPQDAKRVKKYWQHMAMASVGIVLTASLGLVAWKLAPKYLPTRSLASESKAVTAEVAERARKEIEKNKFSAPTTQEFKKTYTDNVLYTTNFVQTETSPAYRKTWIVELNKVGVTDWNLSENVIVPLVAKELTLVQELLRLKGGILPNREKEGISRMRRREAEFQAELKSLLKSKDLVDRFHKFKRSFYQKNQNLAVASLKEEK